MRRTTLLFSCLTLVALAPATAKADPELRYSTTAAGGVTAIGNTLGLSKALDVNGPGTEDSIGTFLTLQGGVDDFPAPPMNNAWFEGTTNDWTVNGSASDLVIPSGAEVLYAELVWGGSTFYGTEDVRDQLNTPVTLAFGDDEMEVEPDPATELTIEEFAGGGFAVNYYMRSAEVTEFVAEHRNGTYSTNGVPATQDSLIDELNAAGWTMVVVYRDSQEPVRNLTVFVGGSFVDEGETEDYSFAGFCTPPTGTFGGSIVVSAIEGDADRTGDGLAISTSANDPFSSLSGPNNPESNFFCSQINGSDGALDEAGTAGDRNHDAVAGSNISGGRQGWDITEVPVSSEDGDLQNGQTEAVVRTETAGDSFVPVAVSFEIEVNAPSWENGDAGAAPTEVAIEETSTVTVEVENVGMVVAEGLSFTAPLPDGLELESFTINGDAGDIDGNDVATADLSSGVNLGDADVNTPLTIEFTVRSVGAPANDEFYLIQPTFDYSYVSCVGEAALDEPFNYNVVQIDFIPDEGEETGEETETGNGDEDSDSMTDTMTDSDTNEGTDSGNDTFGGEAGQEEGTDDGCNCSTNSGGTGTGLGLLALLGLMGIRRRRGE